MKIGLEMALNLKNPVNDQQLNKDLALDTTNMQVREAMSAVKSVQKQTVLRPVQHNTLSHRFGAPSGSIGIEAHARGQLRYEVMACRACVQQD